MIFTRARGFDLQLSDGAVFRSLGEYSAGHNTRTKKSMLESAARSSGRPTLLGGRRDASRQTDAASSMIKTLPVQLMLDYFCIIEVDSIWENSLSLLIGHIRVRNRSFSNSQGNTCQSFGARDWRPIGHRT
jgi:hypothetical protein